MSFTNNGVRARHSVRAAACEPALFQRPSRLPGDVRSREASGDAKSRFDRVHRRFRLWHAARTHSVALFVNDITPDFFEFLRGSPGGKMGRGRGVRNRIENSESAAKLESRPGGGAGMGETKNVGSGPNRFGRAAAVYLHIKACYWRESDFIYNKPLLKTIRPRSER
jgi:hypothetical protein